MAESGLALLTLTLILRNGRTNRICKIQSQRQHWRKHIEGDKGFVIRPSLFLAHEVRREMHGLNGEEGSREGRSGDDIAHLREV